MQRKIKLIILASLLVGSAVVCAIRWKAWFAIPPEPKWEGDTIEVAIKTFADEQLLLNMQKDSLEFLLLGDIHSSLDTADFKMLSERHPNIHFWAQLGDWMERPYHYYEQMMYQSLVGTRLDSLPVVAIPGNHEYLKGVVKTLPAHWKTIFSNPLNGPTRFLGTTYYVDFPHVRLIAIDTDGLHCVSDYTQVAFWLKKTLREARNKFTIVMMHHPVHSTAEGRSTPLMWLAFHNAMREADIVFSGHDHNYARHTEYYKARFWKKEEPTVFISTNASTKKYPVKEKKYEASLSGEPVYEHIFVTPTTLHISTHNLYSGEVIDKVEIIL